MMIRQHRSLASTRGRLVAGFLAVPLTVGLSLAGVVTAQAATTSLAPAVDGAASGGHVIVVLKPLTGMNLRTQASQWTSQADDEQAPVVSAITSAGGTGVQKLLAPDAVAATVPASAVAQLRANPAVTEIVPDSAIQVGNVFTDSPAAAAAAPAAAAPATSPSAASASRPGSAPPLVSPASPPLAIHTIPSTCPAAPVQEPEAVADVHASDGNPNDPGEANSIATGKGVIIANQGMNSLAGNPDLQRADGSHVVINAPDYTSDLGNDETFMDAATMGAQGLNVYQYSQSLPSAGVPAGCTFVIKGDAPDASLVDLTGIDTPVLTLSQVMAGVDATVTTTHADVISESFGDTALPSRGAQLLAQADEAAVAAGVTVVESSGDSGPQGSVIAASDDPAVIAAGGVDNMHIIALNDGDKKYQSNQMAAQSSGGVAPTGKVVDLVASDWHGGETACAPLTGGCPVSYPTEVAAGTSESAPLIAGAAADVIQAYRDTHNGASPTPAMIKSILTGTATSINAPADEQGSGLLNVYAAVRAAQQMPGSTYRGPDNAAAIMSSPTQLDVTGNGGTVSRQSVSLFNASGTPAIVTAGLRKLGPEHQIGRVVSENVTAPDPSLPVPAAGAAAARPVTFTVPPGVDRLDADVIWPDPDNSSPLFFDLFNPQGALVQESYDDGTTRAGSSPNMQHAEVTDPAPGRWTAVFRWGGNDDHLELPPATPGAFRGALSFKVAAQHYTTAPGAIRPVRIPAHGTVSVPVNVAIPAQPGDRAESLQLQASNGASLSLPIATRTLIPANGGNFSALITATSARDIGQISTFEISVPAGRSSLNVALNTADASADNNFLYELVDPTGTVVASASTPQTVNGVASAAADLTAASPAAGLWQIDVVLRLTVSGNEFAQTVTGQVQDSP